MDTPIIPLLTKKNFKKWFAESTGQVHFPNPFDYEGEERKRLKKIARWYLTRVWSDASHFGWHNDPYTNEDGEFEGWFGEYGEYSEMALALLGDDEGSGADTETYVVLATEAGEIVCLEDGNTIILLI